MLRVSRLRGRDHTRQIIEGISPEALHVYSLSSFSAGAWLLPQSSLNQTLFLFIRYPKKAINYLGSIIEN